MPTAITDDAFGKYLAVLKTGLHNPTLLPGPISSLALSSDQRAKLVSARKEATKIRKAYQKASKDALVPPVKKPTCSAPKPTASGSTPSTAPMTKLRRLLFLQSNTCFYCRKPLTESEANIDHILARSLGGKSDEENVVACHKSVNTVFANLSVKRKVDLILSNAGRFSCP